MKKIIYLLLFSILLYSCGNSTKLMQSGNYDSAIEVALRKLKKKKQSDKEKFVLESSFKKANDRDKDKILFLKKEGTPANWNTIFDIYTKMKSRQESVKPILPLHITSENRDAVFEIVNYDDELISAKKNAAEYSYANALALLDKGNKTDARKAYAELQRVKSLYGNYRDIDAQLLRARNSGTSYVLFKMQNNTGVPLPPSFEEELDKISLTELDADWIRYHTHSVKEINYDYTIFVNMKNISVSPEAVKEIDYTESKTVPDGYQYVMDARGNVKKDSLGNDIKIPKIKTITCAVSENYQNKKATIAGTLDYINNSNGQLLKTDPITSDNFFEYRSATAIGDINALKPETKEKIGRKPVPFPSNFDMLLQAGQTLKNMVKDIIYANKNVLY